jgi:hypothetical protein
LCINQREDADKSALVGIMKQTYERAKGIILGLGEANYALELNLYEVEQREKQSTELDNLQETAILPWESRRLAEL